MQVRILVETGIGNNISLKLRKVLHRMCGAWGWRHGWVGTDKSNYQYHGLCRTRAMNSWELHCVVNELFLAAFRADNNYVG